MLFLPPQFLFLLLKYRRRPISATAVAADVVLRFVAAEGVAVYLLLTDTLCVAAADTACFCTSAFYSSTPFTAGCTFVSKTQLAVQV